MKKLLFLSLISLTLHTCYGAEKKTDLTRIAELQKAIVTITAEKDAASDATARYALAEKLRQAKLNLEFLKGPKKTTRFSTTPATPTDATSATHFMPHSGPRDSSAATSHSSTSRNTLPFLPDHTRRYPYNLGNN